MKKLLIGVGVVGLLAILGGSSNTAVPPQAPATANISDVAVRRTETIPSATPAVAPIERKTVAPAPTPASVVAPQETAPASVPLSNDNYYTNSQGNEVHSPAYAPERPAGASAQCRDGTYSFSQSRRGTCSYHGGVAEWY